MPNARIAEAAIAAMHQNDVESRPGYCSRFARQVVSKIYGNKYRALFGASAIDSGRNFQRAGLDATVVRADRLEVGDLLFKMRGSGGFGHVGIYVGERGVAENSSTRLGRVSGAKGFRSVGQYGTWDVVGRIPGASPPAPDPDPAGVPDDSPIMYRLVMNGQKIADMPVIEGTALCPVRLLASALRLPADWNGATHRVMLDGQQIDMPAMLIEDRAYLPITVLADFLDLKITPQFEEHVITLSKAG